MRITVPKSAVEAALAPILKMISGVKLPDDFHPTLTVQSDKQSLWIGCTLPEEQLFLALTDATFDEKNTSFDVNLETFRKMTAAAKGTSLFIEQDAARVVLNCDDRFIGQLVPMTSTKDARFEIPKDADTAVLPTNFPTFLLQALGCASREADRTALTGVSVSAQGVAGTDGKQLFHLPLPLKLREEVILPPSKCHAALKGLRWTALSHWRTSANARMAAITGDGFRHVFKAIDARYPDYRRLVAAEAQCDAKFTLTRESALELLVFLDRIRDCAFAKLTVRTDRIEIDGSGSGREAFAASGEGKCLPCAIHLNPCYLRQFLKMGFLSLSLSSKSPAPVVSSSGTGKYLFMPYGEPTGKPAVAPTPVPVAAAVPAPTKAPAPASRTVPQTNHPKEKPAMTQNPQPSPVFVPSQTVPSQTAAVASNPLDETLASIVSMREQLSALETRLLEAGRKIKAALIEQRQKERQFAEATRKLERIRMAV